MKVRDVISESDVVERARGFDESERLLHRLGRRAARPAPLPGTAARNLMSSPAVAVEPTMSDYGAVWLMCERDIDRLPVVERGRVVGVSSRADLIEELARTDASIAADIRTSVIDALPVPDVNASVEKGRVLLTGVVDTKRDRACLPHAVCQVPGVVAVESSVRVRDEEKTR